MPKKILILAVEGDSTRFLYNYLKDDFEIEKVIIEEKVSKLKILKNRVKRVGLSKVIGQVMFMVAVPKLLSFTSKKRLQEIKQENGLKNDAIPKVLIDNVSSINSPESIHLIQNSNPDFIVVNGTRIISSKVLSSVSCPIINVHAGITPKYRGVHGGYWALANKDSSNCGVTVHLVDSGVDTGSILKQAVIEVTKKDNYSTYPVLQQAKGLVLLKSILLSEEGIVVKKEKDLESKLWYHPTLWQYLGNRISNNVK